jgi:mRNA interferase YafQ
MRSPKRGSSSKRAKLPRRSDYTKDFQKDREKLTHSGRYDMRQLKQAMMLIIANDGPLEPEWRDHALTGDWSDHRECHIGGDFLLIYLLNGAVRGGHVVFVRAGTHSELFD